ncbi:jg8818 [Pararge aegeria aegeria]|uniref:Jg8818 protein n=1 Tax=Pararge aegeria aegeria TaxID=348720 RepID=A0A8S4SIH0_9NEOP|nr:jg8818 [Pararge aegeria aegeria]
MAQPFENDEPFVYRLNDNGSGPSLLVRVCTDRGWRIYQGYTGGDEKWNLWWRTSAFPATSYKALGDWQFMNHIPKGGSICRKDSLSRLLRCMRRIYGSIYDFSPPCFHLPLEYAKLVSECSRLRRGDDAASSSVVWIHKPVAQSQGRGIFLFRAAGTPPARNCFEFYGFDVLLDDTLKPWLIEVNLSPALAADCEADVIVKQPMLHELFDLLGLPMKHTGLSLLQGPPTPHITSYSSEDESGATKPPSRAANGHRRGARRVRRRRAMPIHCVNLQAPTLDKCSDLTEKSKDVQTGRLYKSSSEISCEGLESHLSIEDARESVAHVSKFLRATREVAREGGRDKSAPRDGSRDAFLEAALRKKLEYGSSFEVWLPPF